MESMPVFNNIFSDYFYLHDINLLTCGLPQSSQGDEHNFLKTERQILQHWYQIILPITNFNATTPVCY